MFIAILFQAIQRFAGVSFHPYIRNFTILDRDDRRKLLKRAIERVGLSSSHWAPAATERILSNAKNNMLTAALYEHQAGEWHEQQFARIYRTNEVLQKEMGCLDFDDLLMRMAMLLAHDEALRDELESRYPYVLIDEYQDTNEAQY